MVSLSVKVAFAYPANALYGPCPWLILSAACALHPGRQILRPLYSGNTADKLVYAKLFESKSLRKY